MELSDASLNLILYYWDIKKINVFPKVCKKWRQIYNEHEMLFKHMIESIPFIKILKSKEIKDYYYGIFGNQWKEIYNFTKCLTVEYFTKNLVLDSGFSIFNKNNLFLVLSNMRGKYNISLLRATQHNTLYNDAFYVKNENFNNGSTEIIETFAMLINEKRSISIVHRIITEIITNNKDVNILKNNVLWNSDDLKGNYLKDINKNITSVNNTHLDDSNCAIQ